jgi:hypothetical protein
MKHREYGDTVRLHNVEDEIREPRDDGAPDSAVQHGA